MEIKFADSAGLIVLGVLLLGSALFPEFAQAIGRLGGKKISVRWRAKTRVGVGIFGGALMLLGILLSFRGTLVAPAATDLPTATPVPTNTPTVAAVPTNTPTATPIPTSTATASPPGPAPVDVPPCGDFTIVQPSCGPVWLYAPSQCLLLRLRWGATTSELAERGADLVDYTVTLDGGLIPGIMDYRRPATFVANPTCPWDPSDAWWVYWDYPMGRLRFGEHIIEATLVISSPVDTGWTVVPAGTMKSFRVPLYPVAACPIPPCS
jgi:hypothetical protein